MDSRKAYKLARTVSRFRRAATFLITSAHDLADDLTSAASKAARNELRYVR